MANKNEFYLNYIIGFVSIVVTTASFFSDQFQIVFILGALGLVSSVVIIKGNEYINTSEICIR